MEKPTNKAQARYHNKLYAVHNSKRDQKRIKWLKSEIKEIKKGSKKKSVNNYS
jgi:hypothetical protein